MTGEAYLPQAVDGSPGEPIDWAAVEAEQREAVARYEAMHDIDARPWFVTEFRAMWRQNRERFGTSREQARAGLEVLLGPDCVSDDDGPMPLGGDEWVASGSREVLAGALGRAAVLALFDDYWSAVQREEER